MFNNMQLKYHSKRLVGICLLTFLFCQATAQAQTLKVLPRPAYWKLAIPNDTVRQIINLRVPPNYYTMQTGFFCNKERAFEKRTKVPLKIRLGSLSYTEQLEGY
jgi:hypothetical protein